MKYTVDGWNNFCRVFRLPEEFPNKYCFGDGHPVNFQMIDWFNPVPGIAQPAVTKKVWIEKYGNLEKIKTEIDLLELAGELIPWLKEKDYYSPVFLYLILFDFGASLVFGGE